MTSRTRCILGYSGGLDTSVAIRWLQETYDVDVVCVLVDVGQPLPDLDDAVTRAKANGAADVVVVDAKTEFAKAYVVPAIRANALYEDVYPLATALARPLIAAKLVDVAHAQDAAYVAHGCTGKGNDQVRFELTIRALDPTLKVVAPLREWKMTREGEIVYAAEHGILIPDVAAKSTFSTDENLWGRSVEAGVLEDPDVAVPPEAYAWTTDPVSAPAAETITLAFEGGVPVAVDGKHLPLAELVGHLNNVAGRHGVGRIDHVENRLVGIKSREVYEAPAAITILAAKKALDAITLPRDLAHFQTHLSDRFSDLVYDGFWASPLREAISAFFDAATAHVTGEVDVQLHKGTCTVVRRRATASLYDTGLATYDEGDAFDHDAAAGFIKLLGQPLVTWAHARHQGGPQP